MNKTFLGAIIAVVVIVGAVLLMNNNAAAPSDDVGGSGNVTPTPTPTPDPSPTHTPNPDASQDLSPNPKPNPNPSPSPSPTPTPTPKTHTVSMTDSGYSPTILTVKKGDTVKFVNNGTKDNWPASAPHPTHTDYPAFDAKQAVTVGSSWSFTFDRVGTWRYHNHLNPVSSGSITVTQ